MRDIPLWASYFKGKICIAIFIKLFCISTLILTRNQLKMCSLRVFWFQHAWEKEFPRKKYDEGDETAITVFAVLIKIITYLDQVKTLNKILDLFYKFDFACSIKLCQFDCKLCWFCFCWFCFCFLKNKTIIILFSKVGTYLITTFNPFAPKPPITACADPGPFYQCLCPALFL